MDEIYTEDLSQFDNRELGIAGRLLSTFAIQRPDFLGDDISLKCNMVSGVVFLVDECFNVGVLLDVKEGDPDKIGQFIKCPICNTEGFVFDLDKHGNDCCRYYLVNMGFIRESNGGDDDGE